MLLSEEIYRAVIVAAITSQGKTESAASLIEETVDALIAADRKLSAYESEILGLTSGSQPPNHDKGL